MKCHVCNNDINDGAVFCPSCGMQQPGTTEPHDYQYAAFISYRHFPRDAEVAMAVQKAIETYHLPRGVSASNDTLKGRKLGRVFRDEDELPAAHSLPEHIATALAQSHALVVICSPDTLDSYWVRHEVNTFAELHGRERIFAVLASGDEHTSIPDFLKTITVMDASGVPRTMVAEPLAANLTPESPNRPNIEKLRIIASVAGCGFDDLRQREKARKRRTIATAAAAAALIGAIFGVLAHQANVEHRNALQAESYQLTIESQRLLEQGDRYGAIECALEALPGSSTDTSRPFVPEAKQALEDALQVNTGGYAYWLPSYTFETDSPVGDYMEMTSMFGHDEEGQVISDMKICEGQNCFAVSTKDGSAAVYDMTTGRKRFDCPLPSFVSDDANVDTRRIAFKPVGDLLVVSSATGEGFVGAFDLESGTQLWSREGILPSSLDVSSQGNVLSTISFPGTGGMNVELTSLRDGNTLDSALLLEDVDFPSICYSKSALGATNRDVYVIVGGTLMHVEFSDSGNGETQVDMTDLAYPSGCTLSFRDGVVVATSMEAERENATIHYAVQAFDQDLNQLWSHDRTFRSQVIFHTDNVVYFDGNPWVWGFLRADEPAVVTSAGRSMAIFDLITGDVLYDEKQSGTIVNLQVIGSPDDSYSSVFIATSDGTTVSKFPLSEEGDYEGDASRMVLPDQIRWAGEEVIDNKGVVVALSAANESRIFTYRTNYDHLDDPYQEYSLEELTTLAHETLVAAGRE